MGSSSGTREAYLCVHAHFYQPPREDPFTSQVPREKGAEPYHDFNEKINAECYRPNARLGNFERISFDLGPTLAAWLEQHDPDTYQTIIAADRANVARFGHGNAIAQVYSHAIMPLATLQEKRVQIAWGIADFEHRFGRRPEGMWLAETAVDLESLRLMAEAGLRFTILAPWQVAESLPDPTEPLSVALPGGGSMAVFVFNGPLSGGVSFDPGLTINADAFAQADLLRHVDRYHQAHGEPPLLTIATDGELYGHHQAQREHFLARLLTRGAPAAGFAPTWPARFLARFQPRRQVTVREASSWSCHHGVARWRSGCACTEGDGTWKWYLRVALNRLAAKIDCLFELHTRRLLREPWPAVEDYLSLRLADVSVAEYLARHTRGQPGPAAVRRLLHLLEAQYYRHLMFVSCAFFFEDLDRLEPRKAIAYATRAARLVRAATGLQLEQGLAQDLAATRSWRTRQSGADLYHEFVAEQRSPAIGQRDAA